MVSWIFFAIIILFLLAVDLFAHRKHHGKINLTKQSLLWSAGWITLALLFNLWIYATRGKEPALNFLTGYLVELALSVDNLFIFLLIFKEFHIPKHFRHTVLFWGVISAFIMRILFIIGGIALVTQFHAIFYVFGIFLIFTGIKLFFQNTETMHPEKNPIILWLQRFLPVTTSVESGKFFERIDHKLYATPLFLTLVAVEITDLIFALDSIPAILGITTDPFIVITSNIFAILGLRSLYFSLEGTLVLFKNLHLGLAGVLIFIGAKMLLSDWITISTPVSLGVIAVLLLLSVIPLRIKR